jgi:2-methylisocitrate lyase-like PEP mutase family enzyme
VAAGADMVYPDAIASEEQIKKFVDGVNAPVSINMGFGIRSRPTTPLIPVRRLQELGVKRVTVARMLPAAAIMGMMRALELFRDGAQNGTVHDRPDLLVGIDDITDLMGYPMIDKLETEFLLPEDIERKYGSSAANYVVREKR